MIGLWVKLLHIPYRLLFPSAVFMVLGFPMAPILPGFVLGPMLEDNFRCAMLLSRSLFSTFEDWPASAAILAVIALLIAFNLIRSSH